nr:ribonuclease H-like domain-containing protein [Tanacetum cinerariifolium]
MMGSGSETGGLYLFNQRVCLTLGKSIGIIAYDSKNLWHNRLGYHIDQVIDVMHNKLQMSFSSHVSPCDICHRAKQTREPFFLVIDVSFSI